jgi:hypothetical protein
MNEKLKNLINKKLLRTFPPNEWELISIFIICKDDKNKHNI